MKPFVALAALVLAGPALAEEVLVFAASSLQGPLDRAAAAYEAQTGQDVVMSYAGSAALARQILAGAPADLYLSAAPEWVDQVQQAGLFGPEDRRDLWGNALVLVGPAGAAEVALTGAGLESALDGGFLATGLVDSVPAGSYARAALTALGLWDGLLPQVVQVDNVRIALGLVARREAALAVVYATDALSEPEVAVLARFPAELHPPIVYPGAALTPAGAAFLSYLAGPEGQAPFDEAGFLPPP